MQRTAAKVVGPRDGKAGLWSGARRSIQRTVTSLDHPAGRAPLSRWLLLLGAFVTSIYVALTAPGTGDYPNDAGPAMTALLHANLHAFASATPAMGELSLYLRLPFAALAYLGSPTEMSIYRWGAVPCVASVALLGVWLARIARSRGTGLVGQVAIVAVALFNPMVHSALLLGHPEELLTTSLAVGAIVSAAQRRVILTTVLLGLAIASKQWAVIAMFPVVAVFPGRRVHVISGAAAIVTAVSLPALLISAPTFLHNQLVLVHEHYLAPAWDSWLFLVSPRVTLPVGGGLTYTGPHLSSTVVGLLHPLIIGVAIAIGVYVARRVRTHLTLDALVCRHRARVSAALRAGHRNDALLRGSAVHDAARVGRTPGRATPVAWALRCSCELRAIRPTHTHRHRPQHGQRPLRRRCSRRLSSAQTRATPFATAGSATDTGSATRHRRARATNPTRLNQRPARR